MSSPELAARVSNTDMPKYLTHLAKKELELPFETKLFLIAKTAHEHLTQFLAGELPAEKWQNFSKTWQLVDPDSEDEKFDALRPRLCILLQKAIQDEETRVFMADAESEDDEAKMFHDQVEAPS